MTFHNALEGGSINVACSKVLILEADQEIEEGFNAGLRGWRGRGDAKNVQRAWRYFRGGRLPCSHNLSNVWESRTKGIKTASWYFSLIKAGGQRLEDVSPSVQSLEAQVADAEVLDAKALPSRRDK